MVTHPKRNRMPWRIRHPHRTLQTIRPCRPPGSHGPGLRVDTGRSPASEPGPPDGSSAGPEPPDQSSARAGTRASAAHGGPGVAEGDRQGGSGRPEGRTGTCPHPAFRDPGRGSGHARGRFRTDLDLVRRQRQAARRRCGRERRRGSRRHRRDRRGRTAHRRAGGAGPRCAQLRRPRRPDGEREEGRPRCALRDQGGGRRGRPRQGTDERCGLRVRPEGARRGRPREFQRGGVDGAAPGRRRSGQRLTGQHQPCPDTGPRLGIRYQVPSARHLLPHPGERRGPGAVRRAVSAERSAEGQAVRRRRPDRLRHRARLRVHGRVREARRERGGPGARRHRPEGFSGLVAKVRASGADAVFFGGYYDTAGALSRQLGQAGVDAP